MPATFTAVRGAFTPSSTNDNCTLHGVGLAAGNICWLKQIGWGGRLQQSTAYRTRWFYPSAGSSGSATNLTAQGSNPAASQVFNCASTFAVLQITPPADPQNLYALDWNAQGGEGSLTLPINKYWAVLHAGATFGSIQVGHIGCRNTAGFDANGSHYTMVWVE